MGSFNEATIGEQMGVHSETVYGGHTMSKTGYGAKRERTRDLEYVRLKEIERAAEKARDFLNPLMGMMMVTYDAHGVIDAFKALDNALKRP